MAVHTSTHTDTSFGVNLDVTIDVTRSTNPDPQSLYKLALNASDELRVMAGTTSEALSLALGSPYASEVPGGTVAGDFVLMAGTDPMYENSYGSGAPSNITVAMVLDAFRNFKGPLGKFPY